jgi:hypothetical protein
MSRLAARLSGVKKAAFATAFYHLTLFYQFGSFTTPTSGSFYLFSNELVSWIPGFEGA